VTVRNLDQADFAEWLPLWHGYDAVYGRSGATALPDEIIRRTWAGRAGYLLHRSTTAIVPVYDRVAERSGFIVYRHDLPA